MFRSRMLKTCAIVLCIAWGSALSGAACGTGVTLNPFGTITSLQLFDQPDHTVAFSIESAVTDPSAVAKVNWVFGDGGGFVAGAANRTTITHLYVGTGDFQVTAFVFDAQGNVEQINGLAKVVPSGNGPGGPLPTDLPGQILGPNPVDNATNVAVNTKLTWTAGSNATSHDVYLGTSETAVTNATDSDAANFKGNQTTTSFDPGGLAANTTFFWRIDEVNSVGITKGTVRKFTTVAAPTKAKTPVPQNGSMNARVDQVLQWVAGTGATSHDVYFGTNMGDVAAATVDTPDIFKGNQTGVMFDPEDMAALIDGELIGSTQYFWRVDEKGPGGTTAGDVWAFTTRAPPPMITNPNPADTSVDINISTVLTWNGAASIESYDVYLGVDPIDVALADRNSPEFLGNRTSKNFTPSTLFTNTDYFWRIDTLGPGGTTMGMVFTFKTADFPAAVTLTAPANLSLDQDVESTLMWMAGVGGGPLTSFEVFLSTNQSQVVTRNASARVATLGSAATMHDITPAIAANTNFFWTVDAMGPGGRQEGPIFTFRTGLMPNLATMPTPANNANSVAADVVLNWTAGANTLSHNVYFGTSSTAVANANEDSVEFKGNLPVGTTFFNPPDGVVSALASNTPFFWRIDEVGTGGVRTGTVWTFTTGPGKAINPTPANGGSGSALTAAVSWTAGAGATSHDVYFGTSLGDVTTATPLTPSIYRGSQAGTTFDPPGDLVANTAYFWRIDEKVGTNITHGDVWMFTTILGKATNPAPANMATGVEVDEILEWTAGIGADMHDVYFGTSLTAVTDATTASAEYRGQQSGTLFDPASVMAITANTLYYWRIDTVASGGAPVTKGDTWRYTTLAPPGLISGPSPLNGATLVSTSTSLTWASADRAEEYDVYFVSQAANGALPPGDQIAVATTTSLTYQGRQTNRVFNPGMLTPNTTYLWRVDAVNGSGTTAGGVFTFTTAP